MPFLFVDFKTSVAMEDVPRIPTIGGSVFRMNYVFNKKYQLRYLYKYIATKKLSHHWWKVFVTLRFG